MSYNEKKNDVVGAEDTLIDEDLAEDVEEEDLTAKLNEMFGGEETEEEEAKEAEETPAEEEKPEEKPAPTSFNDMKSALDAIRARLKK